MTTLSPIDWARLQRALAEWGAEQARVAYVLADAREHLQREMVALGLDPALTYSMEPETRTVTPCDDSASPVSSPA